MLHIETGRCEEQKREERATCTRNCATGRPAERVGTWGRPWRAGTFASREPGRGEVRNEWEGAVMSFTGVDSLDRSIEKANAWLQGADINARSRDPGQP